MNAPVTNLPAEQAPSRREAMTVFDPVPVLDTGRFEHMQRIAKVMSGSSLIPETLCKGKNSEGQEVWLPPETVFANCFLIVNQAVRWSMDPFAVVQCASVVKGKLCFEGKLVAAVLEAKLGVDLDYTWNSEPEGSDAFGIEVRGTLPNGKTKSIPGSVGEWKTTGANSPWGQVKSRRKMLAYRGAREWARLHAPGVMLGVYSDDELADLADNARAARATNIAPPRPPAPPAAPAQIARRAVEIMDAAAEREAAVAAAPPAKPKPPTPPIPPKPPAPPAPQSIAANPEDLFKRIEAALGAVTDPYELAEVMERVCPQDVLDNLMPPDRDHATGIYRKHERRVEP